MKKILFLVFFGATTCTTPSPAAEYPETGNFRTYTIIKSFGSCIQGLQFRFQRQGVMVPYDYMEKYCICVVDDIRTVKTEQEYLKGLEEDSEGTLVPHVLSCNIKMMGKESDPPSNTTGV